MTILILCLIIASPPIGMVVSFPIGERFSEMWLLGENHMVEDLPWVVRENETYRIFVEVVNHMGGIEYYLVYAKFKNDSEPLPSTVNGTPSAVRSLLEYHFFIDNNQTWETEVTFSFSGVTVEENITTVETVSINNHSFSVDKKVDWNEEQGGFYYQLFFELWRYDTDTGLEFHSRFVGLRLNMTG